MLLIFMYITLCTFLLSCIEIEPDPRTCTPGTPGICHPEATCTPVTPYVCSSTRAMSYRCECNQGYTGDGIDCTGETNNTDCKNGINDTSMICLIVIVCKSM